VNGEALSAKTLNAASASRFNAWPHRCRQLDPFVSPMTPCILAAFWAARSPLTRCQWGSGLSELWLYLHPITHHVIGRNTGRATLGANDSPGHHHLQRRDTSSR